MAVSSGDLYVCNDGEYIVCETMTVARHAVTSELLVVYRPINLDYDQTILAMPLDMFNGQLIVGDKLAPRFTKLPRIDKTKN